MSSWCSNNFARGFASVLGLLPSFEPTRFTYRGYDIARIDASSAMRSDWEAIGRDMYSVIQGAAGNDGTRAPQSTER